MIIIQLMLLLSLYLHIINQRHNFLFILDIFDETLGISHTVSQHRTITEILLYFTSSQVTLK